VTVPLFRRRREADEDATAAELDDLDTGDLDTGDLDTDDLDTEHEGAATAEPAAAFVDAPEVEEEDPPFSRSDGPWDISEIGDLAAPETPRLDLGGLQVPGYAGLELRIEVDEESGNVVSAAAVVEDAAVQIQVFAAPRSAGVWREVRAELAEGIVSAGGTAAEFDGSFGRELRTRIPVDSPEGRVMQEARFVGVDGPRWFLRGVFSGTAYEPGGKPELEDVFRGCVVVRGDVPMAPKDPLKLFLPEQIEGNIDPAGRPPLEPFQRGPEITEIH
jgi:Protein of unknown function (DUF3710)